MNTFALQSWRATLVGLGALCATTAWARQRALKAPPGFRVSVLAAGLKNARILAVAPDGTDQQGAVPRALAAQQASATPSGRSTERLQ